MTSFTDRVIGSAKLDVAIYEEVEADTNGTGQALAVVLLASLAGGLGAAGVGAHGGGGIVVGTLAALLSWVAWAFLTYVIGTRLLPEPQTHADMGQMLRTLGFAQSPGIARILGGLPGLGPLILAVVSIWMFAAMVIAVRQALDYTSIWRAVAVCLVGWLLAVVPAILILGLAQSVTP